MALGVRGSGKRAVWHMRSHARSFNPLARGFLNIAGCVFSPATVLRPAALQSKSTRSRAAYGAGKLTAQRRVQRYLHLDLLALVGRDQRVGRRRRIRDVLLAAPVDAYPLVREGRGKAVGVADAFGRGGELVPDLRRPPYRGLARDRLVPTHAPRDRPQHRLNGTRTDGTLIAACDTLSTSNRRSRGRDDEQEHARGPRCRRDVRDQGHRRTPRASPPPAHAPEVPVPGLAAWPTSATDRLQWGSRQPGYAVLPISSPVPTMETRPTLT